MLNEEIFPQISHTVEVLSDLGPRQDAPNATPFQSTDNVTDLQSFLSSNPRRMYEAGFEIGHDLWIEPRNPVIA